MGCISSKPAVADRDGEEFTQNVICSIVTDCPNHFVSLTSTTYGALKLDREMEDEKPILKRCVRSAVIPPFRNSRSASSVTKEEPEIVNIWELMKGLDDDESPVKKHTKQQLLAKKSPKETRHHLGKENKEGLVGDLLVPDGNRALKPLVSVDANRSPVPAVRRMKNTPTKTNGDTTLLPVSRRKSLGSLFDPDVAASFEKEVCQEREQQIKLTVSATTPRVMKATDLLESFEKICPSGGENAVVLYTTTLRGIRKTYDNCNRVRSAVDSYGIQVVERDISMDSGFREELRLLLMGKEEVNVPVLFVKGRLIGGSDEVLSLEDEGKLELLFDGVPTARSWCDNCGGMRFVVCDNCRGSCRILNEEQNKRVKCTECNENGLLHCPVCS